ncbi:MAPEG family protein [Stagnimonas aquatica]|uniref:MAPEG family protein n=1 Tax=Stagnimonas aquatica TaxID=2689987 RepID=A0A3N0V1N1_9GAMM|nr:MAPEG family protein [Stagnimonas aquatica]ROH86689.1 MAPEG family protein [Stagnimonas aquatica]
MSFAAPLLAPVVALVAWTHFMWLWMYATRIPAIQREQLMLDPGIPPRELMNRLPPGVRWKADNYNHLFEAPTLFYAICLTLAVLDDSSYWSQLLAWAYVGLRVVHSIWQSLFNVIEVRFTLFLLSSLVLIAFTARAAMQVF